MSELAIETKPIYLTIEECTDEHLGLLESVIDILAQTADTLYHQQLEAPFDPSCYINGKLVDLLTLMQLYQEPDLNLIGLNACFIPPYADADILFDYSNCFTFDVNIGDVPEGLYCFKLNPALSANGLMVSNSFELIKKDQKTMSLSLYNIGDGFNFLTEDALLGSILKIPTNLN